ncbi:MAG: hypothetical protein EA345_17185 [Halomonas sp.]|nr:FIST N-terminal domain-containing protein [Halomonas sp.]TVP43325.1 MAG: hypothetical protein EA345_17185 [Halomonas sp.]
MHLENASNTPAYATAGTRWMGVGNSALNDSAEATRDAVSQAVAGRQPKLVLLFCSSSYDIATIARTAQADIPDNTVIAGCSTSGEICGREARQNSLVAIALGGEGFTVRSNVGYHHAGPRLAGREAAQGLLAIESPYKVLMLLSDGLVGLRTELVRGAYGVAGAAVPLIGGCAADDMKLEKTFQIHGGEVLSEAVVGIAIGSNAPMAIGKGHGCQRISEPVVVTESDGTWIYRLNDEPALDYFLNAVKAPAEAYHSHEAMPHAGLENMLGLLRSGGEEIRATVGADYEKRSLLCGDVPKGTLVSIMHSSYDSILVGTHQACQDARLALGDHEPLGVIAFDCAARFSLLGETGRKSEMSIIADAFPQAVLGGWYTYGEFARVKGSRGFHNATLALLVLA